MRCSYAQPGAILIVGFLVLGCSRPERKDILVIGMSQTVSTLDPAMHRDRNVETVLRNIFDGLVTRDTDMNVVPEMAASWRVVDPCTWEFQLRPGILFHNGEAFTARDVKFTLERIIQPERIDGRSSPRKGLLGPLQQVEVVDDHTVRLITSEPWPTLIAMLPFQEMVPMDYIEQVGDAYFAEHPVGAGPFRFREWRKGEHLILERFEGYYGGATDLPPVGPAPLRTLIFKPVPETATRVAALKAGECDLIQDLPPHLLDKVIEDPRTRVLSCAGTRSFYLGMNCTRPPFQKVGVRRAFNYAIDMQSIVDTILEKAAVVLPGPLVLNAFGHDPNLPVYEQDLDRARELLAESGYAEGLEVQLYTIQDHKEVATAVAHQLAGVGVTAHLRVKEWGILRSRLEQLKCDFFITSWGNASLDPVGILNPTLRTQGRGNYTGYSNPQVDELLDQAMITMDPEERRGLYQRVERILHADAPWVFGYSMKELYGVRHRVQNWQPTPDGRMNMHDVRLGEAF